MNQKWLKCFSWAVIALRVLSLLGGLVLPWLGYTPLKKTAEWARKIRAHSA